MEKSSRPDTQVFPVVWHRIGIDDPHVRLSIHGNRVINFQNYIAVLIQELGPDHEDVTWPLLFIFIPEIRPITLKWRTAPSSFMFTEEAVHYFEIRLTP